MSFQRFNRADDIVENQRTTVTSGLWTGGGTNITSFFTASTQGNQSASYVEIFNANPATDTAAEVQFSLGYAHYAGSGSIGNSTKTTAGDRQSAAMYSQFKNLILAPNTSKFTFTGAPAASSSGYNDFYFISFQRSRMREKVDPGNWELHLDGGTNKIRLIDDSSAASSVTVEQGGRVFNVVTGSITNGVHTAAASEDGDGGFGLFYPDLGLIVLNADVVNASSSISVTETSNVHNTNTLEFFNGVKGGAYFQARREEKLSSTHYFVRAGNKEFNFSNNPTFFTSSTGDFTQPTFFKDPQVYITTVGLYNDSNELLAVAKLSQPVLKSYSREALIKVKLDF